MFDPVTILHYIYFLVCVILGWVAAGVLDSDGLLKRSSSRFSRFLLRLGVALVLAEGFRIFLSYAVGPLFDMIIDQSVTNGFKQFKT